MSLNLTKMGAKIGRVFSTVLRPFRNFNVRERAHKHLESEKLRAAPRYPTEEKIAKMVSEQLPIEEFSKKDGSLLNRLKDVYVTSPESNTPSLPNDRKLRPLPTRRRSEPVGDMGYVEPRIVPEGKITLQNAVTMISDHSADPENNTASLLAATYKMSLEDVESIVKNFSVFQLYVSSDAKSSIIKGMIPSWFKQKSSVQIESK